MIMGVTLRILCHEELQACTFQAFFVGFIHLEMRDKTMQKKVVSKRRALREKTSGKLKIGDNWNAITIIALSQSNPLKAIAEFVQGR